jgi:transcriptional regulator with XRE-family HTH domain
MVPTKTPRTPPKLREIRDRLGVSQPALAELTGVSQPMLSKFETGENEPKGLRSAHAIAAALGVDVFDVWPHLKPVGVKRAKPQKSSKLKG